MFLESKAPILLDKLATGEPVVGVITKSSAPEWIEILACAGLDYVYVDQMFTAVDWAELASAVRTARGSRMAVIARVQNDPWYGDHDPSVSARVARAMSLGCDGVKVNVYSARQARSAVAAGSGWHRYGHLVPFGNDVDEFTNLETERREASLIIPSVESETSIAEASEIIQIPGLKAFAIAMTDTTRMLGHPMEYEHPEVWRFVDGVVEQCADRGVHVGAGTGYSFRTADEIADRVKTMCDHGIRIIMLQTAEFLYQMSVTNVLARVRSALGY